MDSRQQIQRQLDMYKAHFGQSVSGNSANLTSINSESNMRESEKLVFSSADNMRVQQLLQNAQKQDPTKLDFMGDESDASSYCDSSEAGSFYERQGSSLDQRNASDDALASNESKVMDSSVTNTAREAREKRMGHGDIIALSKFKNLLNTEF